MFKSFSAWFSPELEEEYKGTWMRNGGQLKELAEADIAFVSDRTTSNDESHKPSMIVLRPDWIEDSVRGRRRASLKRYRRTFPALEAWNSSSQDSDLAVGIAAYESNSVLALAPPSMPAYQPQAEIQDLSIPESDISSISHGRENAPGELVPRVVQQPSVVQQMPTTRLFQSREVAQKETFVAAQSGAHGLETFDRVEQSFDSDYRGSADDSDDPINIYSPATPAPRRRNLPKTVRRTKKRAAKTADVGSYEGYFGSTDSEDERHNLSHDTVELHPGHRFPREPLPISTPLKRRRAHQEHGSSVQDGKLAASTYLESILCNLDRDTKELLSGSNPQLRLIDIASTDIRLQPRKGRGGHAPKPSATRCGFVA
ncbi:unnamed protein product [Mortierella alpina]